MKNPDKIAFIILILICLTCIFSVLYQNNTKPQKIVLKPPTIENINSNPNKLSKEDSLILIQNIPVLKLREHPNYSGYKYSNWDKVYVLKADRKSCYVEYILNYYIGYGHQQRKSDPAKWWREFPIYKMSKKEADSLLWSDIKNAYKENERLKRLTLKQDCFDIFISGHKLH